MQFDVNRLAIDGVLLVVPKRFADSRGYFVETYHRRLFEEIGITTEFVQDNAAMSDSVGTLRGLHFQLAPDPQAKLVHVITGSIFDAVVDLRAGSATFGQWIGTTLAAQKGEMLFVPVGFAHAYVTLEPKTHVAYKVDRFYNKAAEAGIRWNDPDIGIDWPIPRDRIKVSERDAVLPLLRDLQTPFRFHA